MDRETYRILRKEQDISWDRGYAAAYRGDGGEPPDGVPWPTHWREGWWDAMGEIARKQLPGEEK